MEKEKKEKEVKLSGKKEKIDTTPTMKQEGTRMNFREAVRAAVTGSSLAEGYESHVLKILDDEGIVGPLGYDPFFEKGRLFVQKGSESKAKKALKDSDEINKLPKIVGESVEFMLEAGYIKQKPDGMWCVYNDDNEIVKEFESVEEAGRFLETELNDSGNPVGESVDVDGRCRGFKEALRRLTYEKIRQMKEKEKMKKEEVEIEEEGEYTSYWMPEGLSKEGAAEFMAAASAAKRDGKKKFKFGDKEYPVTIKVDIPLAKEEVEIDESNELQAVMALDDIGIEAEINKKGEVVVKKKDLKKAEASLKKSFRKGGQPKLVGEGAEVNEESELQKKYKEFYAKMLDKFGVKSPGELDDDKKKEFYDAIEKGWKEGEGPVKEEVELDEEVFYWYIIKGNLEKGKVAFVGTEKQVKLKRHDPKFGGNYVMTKSRKDLKMGDKWKKSMGVSEEVEIDEAMKWEVGVVYHQEFDNGDRAYFRADSVQKNKRWKGLSVDEFGGRQKKAKNNTADEKLSSWETTPKNEIPKALKEDVDLDEKITRDQTYFNSYSDAVTYALKYTKSRGYEVDEDDFAAKVTHGPRKPSEGKTVSQRIDVTKGGKPQKKQLSFQVYNKGGKNPYELNVYVEDVELDEALLRHRDSAGPLKVGSKINLPKIF